MTTASTSPATAGSDPAGPGRKGPFVPTPPPRIRRKIYAITLIVIAVTIGVKGVLVERSNFSHHERDYIRWYRIAKRALAGEPLANPEGAGAVGAEDEEGEASFYKLPPAFAVYVAPLGLLPYGVYVAVYYLLSAAAGIVSVLLAVRLLHGRWLPENPWLLVIPAAGMLPFGLDDLHCGSNNLIVLAVMMGGAFFVSRRRAVPAGLLLGLAVSLKAFPLAMVVAVAATRRWRVVATSLAGVAVWTLLVPAAIQGPKRTWDDTWAWQERIILPYLKGQENVQWGDRGISVRNQSGWATVNRFLRPVNTVKEGTGVPGQALYVNVASLSAGEAAAVFAGLLVVALGLMAWVSRPVRGAGPPDPAVPLSEGEIARDRLRAGAELAAAMGFVLLASPLAWAYFYSLLLMPMAVSAAYLAGSDRRAGRIHLGAFAATLILLPLALLTIFRALGTLSWIALLWFAVMLVTRRRQRRLAASPAPAS